VAVERLQKLIAAAGVCSRRDAERLIAEGRVTVNGQVAHLGEKADGEHDAIKIDGKRLRPQGARRYLLLYKPVGVVTTTDDPEGRVTVIDLVRQKVGDKLYPVGRLDFHSEGLMILTNDGDLAVRVSHPRYGVLREYLVKVTGIPDEAAVERLRRGVVIDERRVVPKSIEMVRPTASGSNSWWKVVVGEGKRHEVRELFARHGHRVQRLIRTAIGGVRDERLKPGVWRDLTPDEVDSLRHGGTRRDGDARTGSSRVHPQAGRVRPGQADRGGPARAGRQGHRQAGLEREPARPVAQGRRGDREGAAGGAPVPGRRRLRPAPGPRRAPRR
jgi:23S rRNA pseudouridine2605 synthase